MILSVNFRAPNNNTNAARCRSLTPVRYGAEEVYGESNGL